MSRVVVRNQAELDEALARTDLTYVDDEIIIDSPSDVWMEVNDTRGLDVHVSGSATVHVYGSSTVRASDTVTVHAFEYASVYASGSATVHASETASVRASDTVTVHAYDSAMVTAFDSATVHASSSATVRAYGSTEVTAYGSATVIALDFASVRAYNAATVTAYCSSTVHAYGSVTVRAHGSGMVTAGSHVAIHRHNAHTTVHGGTIIDHTNLDLNNPQMWADYTGAHIQDGEVVLYKAVDNTLTAGHYWTPTTYTIGQTVTCEDWRDDNDCGGGLHASPHPHQALRYYDYSDAARMLRVAAPLDSIRPIGTDKAKAPMFRVLDEVTLTGQPLTEEVD